MIDPPGDDNTHVTKAYNGILTIRRTFIGSLRVYGIYIHNFLHYYNKLLSSSHSCLSYYLFITMFADRMTNRINHNRSNGLTLINFQRDSQRS